MRWEIVFVLLTGLGQFLVAGWLELQLAYVLGACLFFWGLVQQFLIVALLAGNMKKHSRIPWALGIFHGWFATGLPDEYEDAYSRFFDRSSPGPPGLSAAYHLPQPPPCTFPPRSTLDSDPMNSTRSCNGFTTA